MSDRYKGAILSPTAPTVTPQSAGGIYTSSQQLQYQGQGVWPTAANNPLTNSLRFRSSASAYLSRTPASAGNRRTWTLSWWMKVGNPTQSSIVFYAYGGDAAATLMALGYDSSTLYMDIWSFGRVFQTAAVYRDPSAWYHFVLAFDDTQATGTNRVKLYVNNVLQTFSTYNAPTQNTDYAVNGAFAHNWGRDIRANASFFDGYITEAYLIDGSALTPSSFGTTDAYGIWQPIPYTGAYGTNGFYLPFTDNSALTTSSNVGLGKDFSGNGNYWVTNNISITAGSTYDSMKDVPTNTNSNTANYATLNPLDAGSQVSVASGNLGVTWSSNSGHSIRATQGMTTGKWYWEVTSGANASIGIIKQSLPIVPSSGSMWVGADGFGAGGSYGYAPNTGNAVTNSVFTSYGTSLTNGDIVGVAFDADNGNLYFSKNGTWQNSGNPATSTNPAFTGIASSIWCAAIGYFTSPTSNTNSFNFGQRPFAYTPPSGFYPLNTYNLPTPTILEGGEYMNVVTWTGTGTSSGRSITGVGFQPDFVWGKPRSLAYTHSLSDAVRGANKRLNSGSTSAEDTNFQYGYTSSFDTDGFTTTSGSSSNENWNTTNETFVAWNWKASNAAGVSNTQGTITSTVSANTTAGFSIVTYTGTGSNATIGHGLGVAPSFIIAKARNSAQRWTVYTAALGNGYYGYLNETFAFDTANASLRWNTAPTSSVFGVGTSVDVNNNTTTYVAYCFSQVAGYSAFGSYTGNASTDGPFVFTGFRPRFLMLKRTDSTSDWLIIDSARNTYNAAGTFLYPNLSNAEDVTDRIDFVSNGFKLRTTAGPNNSGSTWIYMAFAENPLKIARAR